jgi:hypothetical protein
VSLQEWFFLDCLNLNIQSLTTPLNQQQSVTSQKAEIFISLVHYTYTHTHTHKPTTKCHILEGWNLYHSCLLHTHTHTIIQSKNWCAMKCTVEAALTTYSLSQVVPSNESCLTHHHLSGDIQAMCYNLGGHSSISNAVKGTFHWLNPSGCTVGLRSTQTSAEMSTRYITGGVKVSNA